VASSCDIGVLDGTPSWQKGRRSGGLRSRQLLSWRAPISIIPIPACSELKMKSPDVNPGDQVIRDRRNKDIAEDEGRWAFPSWPEDEVGGRPTRAYTVKQVVQIMKAAGETTGKVCTKAPELAIQKRSHSKATMH